MQVYNTYQPNNDITIQDWSGINLFTGPYDDPQVEEIISINDSNGSLDDIFIFWVDGERTDNVWEFV